MSFYVRNPGGRGFARPCKRHWNKWTDITKKKGAWLDQHFPSKGNEYSAVATLAEADINEHESSDARLVLDDHYKNLESEKGGDRKTEKFQSSTDLTTEKQQAEQDIGKSRETIKTKSFWHKN